MFRGIEQNVNIEIIKQGRLQNITQTLKAMQHL
jgi:hypothetical protein